MACDSLSLSFSLSPTLTLSPSFLFHHPPLFSRYHIVDMRRLQDYYELGETIGNGGFGAVYAGTSLISGNPVSIYRN